MSESALEAAGIALSETDLTVSGARYGLDDVQAVNVAREPAAATGPILMIVCGALALLSIMGDAGLGGGLLGVALLVGAAIWWTQKRPSFQLRLQLDDGEATPFESQDEDLVRRVAAALETRLHAGGA